jgi:hypothetical protein
MNRSVQATILPGLIRDMGRDLWDDAAWVISGLS